MNELKKIYWLVVLVSVSSCEPKWIPDPINPNLPKYTEEGNNVAGAIVNGKLWEAQKYCYWDFGGCANTLTFDSNGNGGRLVYLDGNLEGEDRTIVFTFELSSSSLSGSTDLLSLNEKKFVIDGLNNSVRVSDDHYPCIENNPGTGQLYFRRVKQRPNSSIIDCSGTFGFTVPAANGCQKYEVFYGRFDYSL